VNVYIVIESLGDCEIDGFGIIGVFENPRRAVEFKIRKDSEFQALLNTSLPDIDNDSTDTELEWYEKVWSAQFSGKCHIFIQEHEMK